MFIAHLPAGYLATRWLINKLSHPSTKQQQLWLLGIGLLGSVLPDVDLLYFYWIDQRQHNHHSYWTHTPIFWLVIFTPPCLVTLLTKQTLIFTTLIVLLLNIMLHLLLDSIAAEILWLYPFAEQQFGLVDVPTRFAWWPLNFMLHWSFAFEVLIVGAGLCQFRNQYLKLNQ